MTIREMIKVLGLRIPMEEPILRERNQLYRMVTAGDRLMKQLGFTFRK